MDQKVSYYKTMVRKKKWPWTIISHFFHVSIVNAHILYKLDHHLKRGDQYFELVDFQRSIVNSWRENKQLSAPRKIYRTSDKNMNRHLNVIHVPGYLQRLHDRNGKQEDGRRMCVRCKKRVQTFCITCNAALCLPIVGSNTTKDVADSCWSLHHN